jgi:hypothetical protein
MPNPSKGPRLYLRRVRGREPVYVIRDGARSVSTRCAADQLEQARTALKEYLETTFRPNVGERRLDAIAVSEVLMLYWQEVAQTKPSRETIGYHIKALLPFWGDKTLDQVKGSTCRGYLKLRSGDSGSSVARSKLTRSISVLPSTVRRELKTLSAAINHWHKESPLAMVPKVTLPPEGERRAVPDDERKWRWTEILEPIPA